MLKRKKSIAVMLAVASTISLTSTIATSSTVYAADESNYSNRNYTQEYEGKDSNGLTWKYIKNNDGTINLYGTSNLSETIYVPKDIDGHKVKSIEKLGGFGSTRNQYKDAAVKAGSIVKKVVLPDTIEYIGSGAWECCNEIEDINIPNSVKYCTRSSIPEKCLSKYEDSEGLVIVNHILVDGRKANGKVTIPSDVTEIADSAFYIEGLDESKLTEIIIPSSVKKIGKYAFYGCNNLKKVKIKKGIETICESAFADCKSLSELQIPDDIENVSLDAFYNCSSLGYRPKNNKDGFSISDDGILQSAYYAEGDIVIPDNVKAIDSYAFQGNKKITSVRISGNTKEIGNNAFEDCTNLKNVILEDGVKIVGNNVFRNSGVEKVTIPDSIEEFGVDVFAECSSLKDACNRGNGLIVTKDGTLACGAAAKDDVTVPNDVTAIQTCAFFGNNKMKSITIPGNTLNIGDRAFQQCENLSEIKLGEGLLKIDQAAFYYCNKLNSITLPDSLKDLGWQAFGSCANLKTVSYKEGLKVDESFQNTPWNENRTNSKGTGTSEQPKKPTGIVSDWTAIDGKWYFINTDGSKKTGWFFDIRYGKWYYLGDDGARQTGWIYYKPYNSWFYLDASDGARKSGWFYDPNYSSWFYLNDDGTMKTGWFYDSNYGAWFYLNGNGTMRTGWFYDNSYGKWYYLYSNGVMARITYINGYYVDRSGAWVY